MATNIEIKARVLDFSAMQQRAAALSDSPVEVIPQEDIFFHSPHGRFKLRVLTPDQAQLVYYTRPDASGPKRSDYFIYPSNDPGRLKEILSMALGVRGVVKKTRYLYMVGQTRIHLDDVEGLGHFMELEVVMRPDQSDEEGRKIALDLMIRLGIKESDLIQGAYMDLVEENKSIIQ